MLDISLLGNKQKYWLNKQLKFNKLKEHSTALTFSPTETLISATFWDAIPPILMAPSVALLAILVADTENTDHP